MALLRAEIQARIGYSSIYDGVVEYVTDFVNERMLDKMHIGSIIKCLNLGDNNGNSEDAQQSTPCTYIKASDGRWKEVSI